MKVAGIDFSTESVDVVTLELDTDRAAWAHFPLDGARGIDRARQVRDRLPARSAWNDAGVIRIAVEKPFSRSMRSENALIRIQGAILACLPAEIPVVEFAPVTWKSTALGKGHAHADKREVAAFVAERWTDAGFFTQDAADAYAIAWAARTQELPDQQRLSAA